jgi:hypothetical protein
MRHGQERPDRTMRPYPSNYPFNKPEGEAHTRAMRIPDDFRPDAEVYAWAIEQLGSVAEADGSIERFRNHNRQLAGARALSCDWNARFAYTAKTDNASATKDKKADLASAVKDFTGSIVAHPDSEKSYLNRGVAYLRLTDEHPDYIKLGFADLDQAQKLDKDDIDVYSYRGEFHLFFATKNPKIRVAEASLAAADYQDVSRLGKSRVGGSLYEELAKTQLEQIDKLLGQSAKPTK